MPAFGGKHATIRSGWEVMHHVLSAGYHLPTMRPLVSERAPKADLVAGQATP